MTPVVITGAGIVTTFAQDPQSLHAALCSGTHTPGRITTFPTDGLPCDRGDGIDPAMLRGALSGRPLAAIDKVGQLAILGVSRSLESAAFGSRMPDDLGLVLGTMFSGAHTIAQFDRRAQTAGPALASPLEFANTVLNAAAGQAAIRLSLRGLNTTIAGGHTSGLQAIAYASDLIAANAAPALIAGGVEELALESYLGFCRAGIICGTNGRAGHLPIPFDADRSGCALAEAAAFVVVEPASAAAARGAHVRAAIAGVASCTDPDALTRGFCESAAIADAIRLALDRAGLMPDEVDAVSSAANGSITADQQEADALAEVFGSGSRRPAVTAMKSVAGETLGASGPLQVIAMCEAIAEGYLPGIAGLHAIADARLTGWISSATRPLPIRTALVTAVSPEGSCSALVLRAAGDGR